MKKNKTILAIGAHPDDVELGCGGVLAKFAAEGNPVYIIDLTQSELSTRGTIENRIVEADLAAKLLGVTKRFNLKFRDGFFRNDEEHQLKLISYIRLIKPDIVFGNAFYDRHPDHGRAAELIRDAVFLSGLSKIETFWDGKSQEAFRPSQLYHYIQAIASEPHFVVDVSSFWNTKIQSLKAYKSQFFIGEDSDEMETFISSKEFWQSIEDRARQYGIQIGCHYGEGFTVNRIPGISDMNALM